MFAYITHTSNRETMYCVCIYNTHYTYVNIHDTYTKHMKENFEI